MSMDLVGTDIVIRNLRKALTGIPPEEIRAATRKVAQPLIDLARSYAPVSKGDHFFFNAKGETVRVVPGNLQRSIQVLSKWNGDPSGIYVGPKIVRRNAKGRYDGSRVNAYYAHFVEYGTASHRIGFGGEKGPRVKGITPRPFMRPAFDSSAAIMLNQYYKALEALVFKHAPDVGSA